MTAATYTLYDTKGVPHVLDGSAGILVTGARGLGMVPAEVSADKMPYAAGDRLRRVATPARKIDLNLFLQAANEGALDALARQVRRWVLPGTDWADSPATAVLRVADQAGVTYQLEVAYGGGLAGDTSAASATTLRDVLTLTAPDPYWSETADRTLVVTRYGSLTQWFPWPPISLVSGNVFAEMTGVDALVNDGDIEAWPVWTIVGPGSGVTLTSFTTGEVLSVPTAIAAGQTLTIDTRPRHKSIRDQDGASQYGLKAGVFWPLAAGANEIQISMPGADAASAVTLTYRPQYASARV